MNPVNVGVVGCGAISALYFKAGERFPAIRMAACADIDSTRAQGRGTEFNSIAKATVDELLADPLIDIILNLTIPAAHGAVARAAVAAGKHVYNEKPLAVELEDGRAILAEAADAGVRVGCAPDTFFGASHQTARKLIDDGAIGEPVAAHAFMLSHGVEHWHPNPMFYYERGGGPMFDMGPYYLTALINMVGPVRRVTSSARITFPERLVTSEPHAGTVMNVETPTHISGIMEFASGCIGTIVTSFDVWGHNMPNIEIYGTEGSMSVPDPNCFGGPVKIKGSKDKEWREVPYTHGYEEQSRGVGVADMALAIQSGRAHRANGEVAFHALEIMHAFHSAAELGRHVEIESTCERPAALPVGLADGEIDA